MQSLRQRLVDRNLLEAVLWISSSGREGKQQEWVSRQFGLSWLSPLNASVNTQEVLKPESHLSCLFKQESIHQALDVVAPKRNLALGRSTSITLSQRGGKVVESVLPAVLARVKKIVLQSWGVSELHDVINYIPRYTLQKNTLHISPKSSNFQGKRGYISSVQG